MNIELPLPLPCKCGGTEFEVPATGYGIPINPIRCLLDRGDAVLQVVWQCTSCRAMVSCGRSMRKQEET